MDKWIEEARALYMDGIGKEPSKEAIDFYRELDSKGLHLAECIGGAIFIEGYRAGRQMAKEAG